MGFFNLAGLLIFIRTLTFIPEKKLAVLAYTLHKSGTAGNPTLVGQTLRVGFDLHFQMESKRATSGTTGTVQ